MSIDSRPSDDETISVKDAIRLKHALNQSIKYRGLNAREVENLKSIGATEWAETRKWCDQLVKDYHALGKGWYISACVLAAAAYLLPSWRNSLEIAIAVVAVHIIGKAGKVDGFREGYSCGYENGVEAGVNKALQIDETEAGRIQERSTEMELDERILKGFNKDATSKRRGADPQD